MEAVRLHRPDERRQVLPVDASFEHAIERASRVGHRGVSLLRSLSVRVDPAGVAVTDDGFPHAPKKKESRQLGDVLFYLGSRPVLWGLALATASGRAIATEALATFSPIALLLLPRNYA